jgi:glycosyltransferase involved in cell wall biosynthesis
MNNIPIDFPIMDKNIDGFPWTDGTPPQYFKEKLPKITIITPSFNQGQYIEETIRSILLQGYPNLEYIIIDGGSTDNTVEIIKKYDKWITYWVSETDKGQSDAINKGTRKSTGDIINWINSDDVLANGALLSLAAKYIENPNYHVYLGSINNFTFDIHLETDISRVLLKKNIEDTMIFGDMTQQSLFYRRDIWQELKGVKEELFFCMDLDLWYRYLTQFGQSRIYQFDIILAHFRHHSLAKTTKNYDIHINEKVAIFISLLKSLQVSKAFVSILQKQTNVDVKFDWNIHNVMPEKLSANIFFWIINWLHRRMTLGDLLKLYFKTLFLQPFHRSWRVYFHIFVVFQRWILGKQAL